MQNIVKARENSFYIPFELKKFSHPVTNCTVLGKKKRDQYSFEICSSLYPIFLESKQEL
jgi:hypothetical protein